MAAALLADDGGGGVSDCGHDVEGDETHDNDHQRDEVERWELGREQEREGKLDLVDTHMDTAGFSTQKKQLYTNKQQKDAI